MTLIATLLLSLTPVQDDPAGKIEELIRRLGAEEFPVRERATEELKKIGKPAEEALKKALADDDPEVRERARAVLDSFAPAEKPKAAAPGGRAPPGAPFFRGRIGGSVSVQSVNGDTTYTFVPGDGTAPFTFHKDKAGAVKLEYTDDKGASKTVEAESIEKFLKDHQDLAGTYGITEDGINYGGTRVSFKGGLQGIPFPRGFRLPKVPLPPALEEEERKTFRAAGATFEKAGESLRAQLDLPEGQGLVALRVDEGSAAEAAGLRKNDILLELDGRKVASIKDVKEALQGAASGVVLRKGKREPLAPAPPKKNY